MPKSTKSEDVQAISKIAGALAELSPEGQQDVLTLLSNGSGEVEARVATRVAKTLEHLDPESRQRVLDFFKSQVESIQPQPQGE
jgi:hypothetical protein